MPFIQDTSGLVATVNNIQKNLAATILTSSSKEDEDYLTKDEKQMKSEFEHAAKSSLCMVDVDMALSETDWINFFKSI
jgi:hypothetical protein